MDGIGLQGHNLETVANSLISTNLNLIAATNLPIYISELDLNIADDTAQLTRLQSLFPLLYESPSVQGVTFWGYYQGWTYATNAWMLGQ